MNLTDQIYAQAAALAGSLEPKQEALLRLLSGGVESRIRSRLRREIDTAKCREDLVAAGALYALAALLETDETARVESFTAGELTVHKGGSEGAAQCLREQAEGILAPYWKDSFTFRGV